MVCAGCGYTVPEKLRQAGHGLTFVGYMLGLQSKEVVQVWLCPGCYQEWDGREFGMNKS
jgi:hypothetical protein